MTIRRILGILVLCLCMASPAWAQENMQSVTQPVKVFQKGYIQVIGSSEEGQSRYRALRAAAVVAQRDLLEVVQGLRLSGTTSVKDGMLQSDAINTSVQGFLRGAMECGQQYHSNKGYADVCMRLNIRGHGGLYDIILPLMKDSNLMPAAKPAFKPSSPALIPEETTSQATSANSPATEQATSQPSQKATQNNAAEETAAKKVEAPAQVTKPYDGLIVDARNFPFRPALVNRILTVKDQVVFGPSKILSNVLVERGCGGFTTDASKAKALLESWGSKHPLIVKSVGVENHTDAKISQNAAAEVYVNDQKSNLLTQARVVFVLK